MASVFPAGNYYTIPFALSGSSLTSIGTVPAGFWWDVTAIRVSVGTGAAGTAALKWTQASSSTTFVLNDAGAFVSGIPYDEECMPLHLEPGDIIKVAAASGNHVFVTYIQGARDASKSPARPAAAGIGPFGPGWGKT